LVPTPDFLFLPLCSNHLVPYLPHTHAHTFTYIPRVSLKLQLLKGEHQEMRDALRRWGHHPDIDNRGVTRQPPGSDTETWTDEFLAQLDVGSWVRRLLYLVATVSEHIPNTSPTHSHGFAINFCIGIPNRD
jgi:hypothetical protein